MDDDSCFSDSDSSNDECTSTPDETTLCLFCEEMSESVESAIGHLKSVHAINLAALKSQFQMDQYSFLKLINCIRSENVPASKLVAAKEVFWSAETYLKPAKYEPWMCYDYDELPAEIATDPRCSKDNLIKSLEEKVKTQALLLEQATDDMRKMRLCFQRLLEKENNINNVSPSCVSAVPIRDDEPYFKNYSHFGIHHEMLSDTVRTDSYRNALLQNKSWISGKDVLDVGCGTAILSVFASEAGAKTVVGIDNSDIIDRAMDILMNNSMTNVRLVKGRLEDTELPQPKFDIIISEWMGYFLLFESMLDTVIYARNNHLKEGGILLPNRCSLSLIGYGDDELFQTYVDFWNNVYGLDMSVIRQEVLREPLVELVDANCILTEAEIITNLNLLTVDLSYSNFSYSFNLKCIKDGRLSAFVGYFDTYFDLPNSVMLSTAPTDPPTHWKQVVFFIDKPVEVHVGDKISGKVTCRRSLHNARSLDIVIEAFDRKYKYYFD